MKASKCMYCFKENLHQSIFPFGLCGVFFKLTKDKKKIVFAICRSIFLSLNESHFLSLNESHLLKCPKCLNK